MCSFAPSFLLYLPTLEASSIFLFQFFFYILFSSQNFFSSSQVVFFPPTFIFPFCSFLFVFLPSFYPPLLPSVLFLLHVLYFNFSSHFFFSFFVSLPSFSSSFLFSFLFLCLSCFHILFCLHLSSTFSFYLCFLSFFLSLPPLVFSSSFVFLLEIITNNKKQTKINKRKERKWFRFPELPGSSPGPASVFSSWMEVRQDSPLMKSSNFSRPLSNSEAPSEQYRASMKKLSSSSEENSVGSSRASNIIDSCTT